MCISRIKQYVFNIIIEIFCMVNRSKNVWRCFYHYKIIKPSFIDINLCFKITYIYEVILNDYDFFS
jgi:hypothetical protein